MFVDAQPHDTIWKYMERQHWEDPALTTIMCLAIDQGLDISMGIGIGSDEDGRLYLFIETAEAGTPTLSIVRDYKQLLAQDASQKSLDSIISQISNDVTRLKQLLLPQAAGGAVGADASAA